MISYRIIKYNYSYLEIDGPSTAVPRILSSGSDPSLTATYMGRSMWYRAQKVEGAKTEYALFRLRITLITLGWALEQEHEYQIRSKTDVRLRLVSRIL